MDQTLECPRYPWETGVYPLVIPFVEDVFHKKDRGKCMLPS